MRKKVVVGASPDVAFTRFTEELDTWWPLEPRSVLGADSTVDFGTAPGEEIVERGADGGTAVWGTVLDHDPPRAVRFTWHPGRPPETAQEIEVRFLSTGDGTEVTLVHTGWEKLPDPEAKWRSYDTGWDATLARYRDSL